MIEEYERMYRAMTSEGGAEAKIAAAQGGIELALKKKSKLLELAALESITAADFKAMTAQCNAEIQAAEREIAELREQQTSSEEFRANMERIRKALRDAERDCANGKITREFIDTFIDKIFATPEDDGTIRLDIRHLHRRTLRKVPAKAQKTGEMRRSFGSHVQEDDRGAGAEDALTRPRASGAALAPLSFLCPPAP